MPPDPYDVPEGMPGRPPDPYDVPEDMPGRPPDLHPPTYGRAEGVSYYTYMRYGFIFFFGGLLLPTYAFFGLDGPDARYTPMFFFGGTLISAGGIVMIALGVINASVESELSPHERMGLWVMVGLLGGFFFLHSAFFFYLLARW